MEEVPVRIIPFDETERVETGVVQFGKDWPGFFMRGDSVCHLAHTLQMHLDYPDEPIMRMTLEQWIPALASANVAIQRAGVTKPIAIPRDKTHYFNLQDNDGALGVLVVTGGLRELRILRDEYVKTDEEEYNGADFVKFLIGKGYYDAHLQETEDLEF